MVHHKIPIEEDPSLKLVDSNLISLCDDCHKKMHPEKIRRAAMCRRTYGDPYRME